MGHPTKHRPAARAMRGAAAVALTALILLLTPILPNLAQDPAAAPGGGAQDDQNAGDPPARVGRLAKLDGAVSFHAADDDEWQPASLNWPVAQGGSFWTEPGARAVIELGGAQVGLDGATEVDIQQLDYQTVLVNVPQGSIYVRMHHLGDDQQMLIATPSGTVQLLTGGRYHIDAGGNGSPGLISVFDGEAAVVGQGPPVMFNAGEAGAITFSNAPRAPAAPSDIDGWADARIPPPAVAVYIPPAMPGAADLAYVGTWAPMPGYGNVWFPPVDADWAPYRFGHWAFVPPWGWTWVDDAPWGFAPFHYGRWAQIDGRWGWIPGEIVAQPVYAPALVTFVGGGGWNPGGAIGIGIAVGWIPLGPQEVYRPWYRTSDAYFRHVNVTNVTNINTVTINNYNAPSVGGFRNYQHATVVDAATMTGSQPVSRAALKVPPQSLAQAPVSHGQVPVKPSVATVGTNPTIVKQAGGDLNGHPAWKSAPGPMQGGKPRAAPAVNLSTIKPLPPAAPGARPGGSGTIGGTGPAIRQPVTTPGGEPAHPQGAPAGTAAPGPEFKKPPTQGSQTGQPPAGTAAPGPELKKPPTPGGQTGQPPAGTAAPGPEFKKPPTPGGQTGQPPAGTAVPGPEFKKPPTSGGQTGSPTPQGHPQINQPAAPPSGAAPAHPQGGGAPANPPGAGQPAPKGPPPKCDPKVQKCP